MSELFTADKARKVLWDALRIKEENKTLEYKKRIEKLIEDTYSLQEIITNIKVLSYDWLNNYTHCTGIMIMADGSDNMYDWDTENILEVLNYLWYKTRVSYSVNQSKRIFISW